MRSFESPSRADSSKSFHEPSLAAQLFDSALQAGARPSRALYQFQLPGAQAREAAASDILVHLIRFLSRDGISSSAGSRVPERVAKSRSGHVNCEVGARVSGAFRFS